MKDKKIKSSGVTFTGLLTCIFIALKLTGHINWSWFWVFSPTILPIIITIGILGIFVLVQIAKEMD